MGLDSLEIVIRREQSFDLAIADAEAATLRAPRMAIDLICRKLGVAADNVGVCLSQRAFHRLRRALTAVSSVPRASVTLDSVLEELLPERNRRMAWRPLAARIGVPSLPKSLFGFLPGNYRTVADLCRFLARHHSATLLAPASGWTRVQVREAVRATVSDVLGIPNFSDDADFVYDLRINGRERRLLNL